MNWSDIRMRLRAVIFPARAERDLEEELAAHIEMQARRNHQSGMSETEEARISRMFDRRMSSSPSSDPLRSVIMPGVSPPITPSWRRPFFVVMR